MRRVLIVSAVLAAMTAPISIASAQAPPGAGVGEYTENIPGAGGDQSNGGGGANQGGSGGGANQGGSGGAGGGDDSAPGTVTGASLPPAVVDEFQQQGANGAAAAELAQSTSPSGSKPGGGESSGNGGGEVAPGGGQGGVAGVVESLVGDNASSQSDGIGVALPIILGSALLGAFLFSLARRRGLGPGSPGSA